ncbi:MAG: fumarylacetoacetate hydrolase family protein [Phycisphaeraceae bacterium]|nr:fumarylacetoacetate hydrolase family protein [Phycisphaeraceae bacterium]MCW5762846.1 fumarylacetoacetate hydrolase family protein [Phycisphaeraceae bacterium]
MDLIPAEFGLVLETDDELLPLRVILGIGRNYAAHAHEQGAAVPAHPMVFMKNPASAIAHGVAVEIPPICRDPDTGRGQVDFEAELAVIIGRPARDVPEERALDHVVGYCCANDVSARWWQKHGSEGQFCRGKSFDTFCPLGPHVTPAAEVPDPQALRVIMRLNGQVMQDAPTSQMMFPVARLIADLSRGTTLMPGTVILSGTPSGVGMARTPPLWIRDGDVMEVEIPGLGILRNPVRDV